MGLLKRSLILFFCALPLYAGDIAVTQFSGLNTQDNPAVLDPSESQDLLNVNITPGGRAVYKRDGYGLFQNLPINTSTTSVHGGYHFQQISGADVQLWGNDNELSASISDAGFVKVATGAVGATWQCADSQGFAYCLSSSRDYPVKTDGTVGNTTYSGTIPLGKMATFTPLQLVVAGVAGNESTLYFSKQNTFTNFTVGPLTTDSFTEVIAAPGSRITHVAYYFGKLFWWKDQSFGFITGLDQYSLSVTIVSNSIGTLDNSSAFWNGSKKDTGNQFAGVGSVSPTADTYPGGIYFRGQDSHIYLFDGYNLTKLTRQITPTVLSSNQRKANSWTQTSQVDFSAGSSIAMDTTTLPGNVQLNSVSNQFVDLSSFTTLNGNFGNTTGSRGTYAYANTAGTTNQLVSSKSTIPIPWNLYSSFAFYPLNPSVSLGGPTAYSGIVDASSSGYIVQVSTGNFRAAKWNGVTVTPLFTTAISITDTQVHTIGLTYSATGYGTAYLDNVLQGTFQDTTYSGSGLNRFYVRGDCITSCSDPTIGNGVQFYNLNLYVSTGQYYSAVNNAPNITSWSNFTLGGNITPVGTVNNFVRSSTSAFTVTSTTPTWIGQPVNSTVAASTGTYFQARLDVSAAATPQSNVPSISDFSFNWFEGVAADKAYIQYFNEGIWVSVSTGTSSTNNRVFYYDLQNQTWLLYDIASNGFLVENNLLYFGSPAIGAVYRFGSVPSDNGAAINSYWKSKDFVGADPFVQNEFQQADFAFISSLSTATYTYKTDTKTSTSILLPLYDANSSLIRRGLLLAVGKIGGFYNFKVGDNSLDPKWTLIAHRIRYNALNWRSQTK